MGYRKASKRNTRMRSNRRSKVRPNRRSKVRPNRRSKVRPNRRTQVRRKRSTIVTKKQSKRINKSRTKRRTKRRTKPRKPLKGGSGDEDRNESIIEGINEKRRMINFLSVEDLKQLLENYLDMWKKMDNSIYTEATIDEMMKFIKLLDTKICEKESSWYGCQKESEKQSTVSIDQLTHEIPKDQEQLKDIIDSLIIILEDEMKKFESINKDSSLKELVDLYSHCEKVIEFLNNYIEEGWAHKTTVVIKLSEPNKQLYRNILSDLKRELERLNESALSIVAPEPPR